MFLQKNNIDHKPISYKTMSRKMLVVTAIIFFSSDRLALFLGVLIACHQSSDYKRQKFYQTKTFFGFPSYSTFSLAFDWSTFEDIICKVWNSYIDNACFMCYRDDSINVIYGNISNICWDL